MLRTKTKLSGIYFVHNNMDSIEWNILMETCQSHHDWHLQAGSQDFSRVLNRLACPDYILIDMHLLPKDASIIYLEHVDQLASIPYVVVGGKELEGYLPFLRSIGISRFLELPWHEEKLNYLFYCLQIGKSDYFIR